MIRYRDLREPGRGGEVSAILPREHSATSLRVPG
jgi:hypothetical protein